MSRIWIFSNNRKGYYDDSDWDTTTILETGQYYFKKTEPNRHKVKSGDLVLFREYGRGFWGSCEISGEWVDDDDGMDKHGIETGWFPIDKVSRWKTVLPYEIIKTELSNQNVRLRIAKATTEDRDKIELALKIYTNLGYGETDGSFFVLEAGIEEAVKVNLAQLNLNLAEEDIQQQCILGLGSGRTDLICRDKNNNFVILELKAVQASDYVVGQILRYMGYVRENWAEKEGVKVKGIIITPSYDEQLRLAAKEAGIKVLRIRIT